MEQVDRSVGGSGPAETLPALVGQHRESQRAGALEPMRARLATLTAERDVLNGRTA